MTPITYRPTSPVVPARPVAAEALRASADLAQALRALEQLPRLMRAAGVARVRIDDDGQIVIVLADGCDREAVQP